MPTLFNTDIAGLLNTYMGPLLLSATLIKVTPGTRGGSVSAGTNPTTANYAARGFTEDYQESQINGTSIQTGDRKVTLLGASIASSAIPEPNDKITIESYTYRITAVQRDPAGATYACNVRR